MIVGAGPTGMVLALWLAKQGSKAALWTRMPEPATTTRALAAQARTLELYRQMDLADALVTRTATSPPLGCERPSTTTVSAGGAPFTLRNPFRW
ncbi:MAG TPA: FAD-dependent monooxygenase [Candidatus Cybelea sp.]|nr:FAD-dependent monooxygenase [Candidatus Cybelea sp.]